MKKHMQGLFLLVMLASAATVQADMLEIRAGGGLTSSDPDSFEDRVNTINAGGLDAGDMESFHADIFFNLPVLPIGFGVRHEWLNQEDSGSGGNLELDVRNIALLVDLRLIDTAFYLGPIVSIGYPWADLNFDSGATHIDEQIDADQISYSAGLEAGIKLGRFLVGAEAGYQSIELESSDAANLRAKVDLSGFYGKAMVGLTFF